MEPERPMNSKQAAERIGISVSRLYSLVKSGKVPFHKPIGKLYFYPSELDAWIKGETKQEEQK